MSISGEVRTNAPSSAVPARRHPLLLWLDPQLVAIGVADAQQPRGRPDDHAERGEHREESHAAHERTSIRAAIAPRKRPKTSFSGRSSIRASAFAPIRAPSREPAASASASAGRTLPATP